MLRASVCLPQGAILILVIFMQFLLVDKYVKQKVNGESSTSGKRVALLAPTASGERSTTDRMKRRFQDQENEATALQYGHHKVAF
jgi:hypothetical protein